MRKRLGSRLDRGLEVPRMHGILEVTRRKLRLQRLAPEGHTQAQKEMMGQVCDVAVRTLEMRQKGHIADDAEELLSMTVH